MSNKHYEHAISELPCRVSSTAHTIYQLICYRFDDRLTLPNGKPNPGHGKSYPGMDAFISATGKTRQACNTAIELLITKKLIVRVTIGKPGSRAEYVPIHTLTALGISVKNTLHVSKEYKPRKVADNVKKINTMSKATLLNETSSLNTISTISNHKYDKFITLLSKDISQYIKPGKNLDKLLDQLLDQGMSLEAVCAHLNGQSYGDRYTIGGTVITHLEVLCGQRKVSGNRFKSKWCSKCDLNTRTFAESSPGVDGKDTYQCPTCHPNQIRVRDRITGDSGLNTMLKKIGDYDLESLLKTID